MFNVSMLIIFVPSLLNRFKSTKLRAIYKNYYGIAYFFLHYMAAKLNIIVFSFFFFQFQTVSRLHDPKCQLSEFIRLSGMWVGYIIIEIEYSSVICHSHWQRCSLLVAAYIYGNLFSF